MTQETSEQGIEYEILPEQAERTQKVRAMLSLLQRVSEWESHGAEFSCLEEGLEFIIDNLMSLQSLTPSRIIKGQDNPDHIDTDFHTENAIQKVIKFGSRTPVAIKYWGARMEEAVSLVLELLITLRQDLQRGTSISKSCMDQEDRIRKILLEGLEPDKPASMNPYPILTGVHLESEEQAVEDKINRSVALKYLNLVPTSRLWKEIHSRRDSKKE